MFFDFPITTPANTAQIAAINSPLKLTAGTIIQVDVLFPGGSAGLLHVQIFNGITQIWPSNAGESFAGDQEKITFGEAYQELQRPFELTAHIWNLDDTYDHEVRLRFAIPAPPKLVAEDDEEPGQIDLTRIETILSEE